MLFALGEGVQVAIVGSLGMISTAAIGAWVTVSTSRAKSVGTETNATLDRATIVASRQKEELAALRSEVNLLREQLGLPPHPQPDEQGAAS